MGITSRQNHIEVGSALAHTVPLQRMLLHGREQKRPHPISETDTAPFHADLGTQHQKNVTHILGQFLMTFWTCLLFPRRPRGRLYQEQPMPGTPSSGPWKETRPWTFSIMPCRTNRWRHSYQHCLAFAFQVRAKCKICPVRMEIGSKGLRDGSGYRSVSK